MVCECLPLRLRGFLFFIIAADIRFPIVVARSAIMKPFKSSISITSIRCLYYRVYPILCIGKTAPRTRGDDPSRRLTDYLAEIVGYNARAARTIYNDSSEIFAYSVEKYAKGGRGDVETAMFETARRKNARS